MRVVVVGQGYVGLPLAIRAAQVGHTVIGYDEDEQRVNQLVAGDSYVEDVQSSQLQAALHAGSYQPSNNESCCTAFEVAVITVSTPLRGGIPDLSQIQAAATSLARFVRPGATIILESTTYPGTTEELVAPLLEQGSGLTAGDDFHLGYSPERIDPGNPVWTLPRIPKLVAGINPPSLRAVRAFYDSIIDQTIPVASPKEAELAKLIENTFRHVNIALVNELAMFSRHLGIDIWAALDAAATKPFGFMPFKPGPGVGGHCLPIDPCYLSWRVQRSLGLSSRFVDLANDINHHMPNYVVRRLTDALDRRGRAVNSLRVLLLGLAYKKNSGDARESPAVKVARLLLDMGAEVRAADPHVVDDLSIDCRLIRVGATPHELAAADAAVLLTDHDGFDYPAISKNARFVLDCRRRLVGPNIEPL